MVGGVGIEPTETEVNGVTDRPSSPTLAPAHISDFKVSQPHIVLFRAWYLLTFLWSKKLELNQQ